MHRFLLAIILGVVGLAAGAETLWVKLDSIASTPGTPEGVWRIASGAVFSIKPRHGRSGVYDLELLHCPDLSVPAGAVFGSMTVGADARTFDASLLADTKIKSAGDRLRARSFVITFDEDFDNLKIKNYRTGISVNLFRLVPYLFRVGIERRHDTPDGIIGATRCNGDAINYPVKL